MMPKTQNSKVFTCPICKKDVQRDNDYFPFCSQRCQTVDLGKWADGSYHIPDTSSPFIDPSDSSTLH